MKPEPQIGRGSGGPLTGLILSAIVIATLCAGRLWWLPARASLNINEGWNATHVMRAFGRGALYPAPDALIANNYPPLSFLIVGLLDSLGGDHIVTGRILSLVGVVANALVIYVVVATLSKNRWWSAAAALLFAGFVATLLRKYLVMNDPQWMAQAVMAWAVLLVLPRRSSIDLAPWRVMGAALLIVAGGLMKHNLVAIPIAITIYLWVTDRRALVIWIATGATLAAVACAVLFAIWGSAVFSDVLAPARSYSWARMLVHGVPLLLFVLPGVLASRPVLKASRDDPRLLLPLILLAVAVPTAIVQRSGDGVDVNAVFETAFALAIVVALGCARRTTHQWRWLLVGAFPAIALVPIAAVADVRDITGRDAAVRHWQPYIARLAAAPGPVGCDDQALCYWAGRESALDFFSLKQRMNKGELPALEAALASRRFAMIETRSRNDGWHQNRLIPLIRRYYRTAYVRDGTELLVAR